MINVTIVKKGAAETCPACNATKASIHRNTYRGVEINGVRASPVYTCMNCNSVYVEDPAPAVAIPIVRQAVAPDAPALKLPGREEPLAPAQEPTTPSLSIKGPVVTVKEPEPEPEARASRPKDDMNATALRLRVALEDLEQIAAELGLTCDKTSMAADIIAEIRHIRNATGLRATYATARALGLHLAKHQTLINTDKRGHKLIDNLREALRLK
jgi:hypothetical protein